MNPRLQYQADPLPDSFQTPVPGCGNPCKFEVWRCEACEFSESIKRTRIPRRYQHQPCPQGRPVQDSLRTPV